MQKIGYYLFIVFVWLFSRLPLFIIHIISDFLYIVNVYLIKYRKQVVLTNLRNSFPEKSEKEIQSIYRKFFRHFFDMFVESMYLYGMSTQEAMKRFKGANIEEINKHCLAGKDATLVTGHYGNWEWFGVFAIDFMAKNVFVYQKLNNPYFDQFWKNLRTKYGAIAYPTTEVMRGMVKFRQTGQKHAMLSIADQCPQWKNINRWTTFMNQDSGWNTGFVRMAQKFNHAIVYGEVQKVKRGYYEVKFTTICEDPNQYSVEEIHDMYIAQLEKTIRSRPELWLWSHKRWKRQQKDIKN